MCRCGGKLSALQSPHVVIQYRKTSLCTHTNPKIATRLELGHLGLWSGRFGQPAVCACLHLSTQSKLFPAHLPQGMETGSPHTHLHPHIRRRRFKNEEFLSWNSHVTLGYPVVVGRSLSLCITWALFIESWNDSWMVKSPPLKHVIHG